MCFPISIGSSNPRVWINRYFDSLQGQSSSTSSTGGLFDGISFSGGQDDSYDCSTGSQGTNTDNNTNTGNNTNTDNNTNTGNNTNTDNNTNTGNSTNTGNNTNTDNNTDTGNNTNTGNNTSGGSDSSSDGIDWDAIYVEGKGYNVAKLTQTGVLSTLRKMLRDVSLSDVSAVSALIDERISMYSKRIDDGKLYELASYDTDNDGFLSATELNNFVKGNKSVSANKKTKVNGKDVVFMQTSDTTYMAVTQVELDILERHLANVVGSDHKGQDVISMMNDNFELYYASSCGTQIKRSSNDDDQSRNRSLGNYGFINAAGMWTSFHIYPGCDISDEIFYKGFLKAKEVMGQ